MTVDKEQVLRDLDAAWAELRGLVDTVPVSEMTQPGVVDSWSLKDLLGHMAFWANKAAGDLEVLSAGHECEIETPGGDQMVAEWNAREAAARRDRALPELQEEWATSFSAARAAFQSTPAEKLELEVKGWPQIQRFLGDTTIHYREHEQHIRTWLKELETTEG